ncbi:MAG: class I SAM-dependent methyltransferase, partial [Candidatus Bathyarchaeota archaeon]|nr:class I SAM-dependent methyltransferase [Candidatus Bathyarchaeota archaeon]
MKKKDRFMAYDAYEKLAASYAEMVDTKPHNAYLERPTTISLLPDVWDKQVLDAGCGSGSLTMWLLEHGAQVTA